MKTTTSLTLTLLAAMVVTHPATAGVVYTETFDTATTASFTDLGWSVYLANDAGGVTDLSANTTNPANVVPATTTRPAYGFTAPRTDTDFSTADGPSVMFTTEPGAIDIATLEALSVEVNADGSGGDPAVGRLAIRIGSQWYASEATTTSTSNNGPDGAFVDFSINAGFTDGNNWRLLTATTGGTSQTTTTGEITVAGSVVGGTLSGNIDAFGIYAANGNGGDHFRITNYEISAIPEPASLALLGLGGVLMLGRRRSGKA